MTYSRIAPTAYTVDGLRYAAVQAAGRPRGRVLLLTDPFGAPPGTAAELLDAAGSARDLAVTLLTKHPERALAAVPASWREAWPEHVWLGTVVECERDAEARVPALVSVPAPVRFLVCEPAHLTEWLYDDDVPTSPEGSRAISWVIVSGGVGPDALPFDLGRVRDLIGQCREAGVPVLVHRLGARPVEPAEECPAGGGCGLDECAGGCRYARAVTRPLRLRDPEGADPAEWPPELDVREFPDL